MKNISTCLLLPALISLFSSCKKDTSAIYVASQTSLVQAAAAGKVSGTAKDAQGRILSGVKITVEHTVWFGNYVSAKTNNKGKYVIEIPQTPAGDWTAKAQFEKAAYGQNYLFDLAGNSAPFSQYDTVTKNFKWKLSGKKAGTNSYYGAHIDLYPLGTDVEMTNVKIIFAPLGDTLIDGSSKTVFERNVEDVAGTYMIKDVPIGKYSIKAVYPGKKLYLDNRHDNKNPALNKPVVFSKYGYLGETEYNIEFWVSE